MKKGNPRLPSMIWRKKKRIYHLPPKRSKGTRQKRSSLFLPVLLLNYHSFLILLLSIVVSIVYRSVTLLCAIPIFSLLLLFLLTWYSAVCYVFDSTRLPRSGTTKTQLWPTRETSQLLIKIRIPLEGQKKKRVRKELHKKEWRLRHLLRRNPSPP